jgi:ABC-type transporter Mla subunit MlaD
MNTEIMSTLSKVRLAEKEVNGCLQANPAGPDVNTLNEILATLLDADDELVLTEIQDALDRLQADAAQLNALVGQIDEGIASLQLVAKEVAAAAQAIGVLADIISKAGAAGLV